MENYRLIYCCRRGAPEKNFLVCDLSDGKDFVDPLLLFGLEHYDLYNINEEGLYAMGGEITPERLIESYKWGIFPWFAYRDPDMPHWYCPEKRFVIYPEKIHVSHSLRSLLNKKRYHVTINQEFERVIHNCRFVDQRDSHKDAWLGSQLEECFIELHKRGYAKSVEVWEGDELVGGFYGFFHNGVFEGDSMFSLRPSASQVGLVELCRNPYIDGKRIHIIDTQIESPTFIKLGGAYIDYQEYREIMSTQEAEEG